MTSYEMGSDDRVSSALLHDNVPLWQGMTLAICDKLPFVLMYQRRKRYSNTARLPVLEAGWFLSWARRAAPPS